MRLTIYDFPDEDDQKATGWSKLVNHTRRWPTDVVVLPEMPFSDWRMFMEKRVDDAAWRRTVAAHDAMVARFAELNAQAVLSSRPVQIGDKRLNQAFAWTRDGGYHGARSKFFLPDEPDGWEATWFDQGDLDFTPTDIGVAKVGFQLCTELLFSDRSREIGQRGGTLIAAPRATSDHRRWPAAARMAAVMSGCFVASANRRSVSVGSWPGRSWVVSPEGEFLAATSKSRPIIGVDIDLADSDVAKTTYPRKIPAV